MRFETHTFETHTFFTFKLCFSGSALPLLLATVGLLSDRMDPRIGSDRSDPRECQSDQIRSAKSAGNPQFIY
jgi:hypothetical protein